jgi:3-methyladenine DNA glycosylase AlkD
MKINNKIHLEILKKLEKYKDSGDKKTNEWVQHYLGSNKPTLGIASKEMQRLGREVVEENNFNEKSLVELLDSLYSKATTFAEIDMAARILAVVPTIRKNLEPELLDYWLNFTHGWAEDDLLCQSNFTAEEVLGNWPKWEKILIKFSNDENVNKRRASMVLLTKSLRESDDKRLSELAFEQVEKMKWETDILITKAISWLLRSLVKFHKDEVLDYLETKKESLPKIAYREAYRKAMTGRKNG